MKTVVAGVDGSDTAARAAVTAADLAYALGAELHIICAFGKFEVSRHSDGGEEIVLNTERDARRLVEREAGRIRDEYPMMKVVARSAEGKPADALVRTAEELDADLIVVGNKRVQGFARVLGSIAADVARRAPCDVYVAHTHQRRGVTIDTNRSHT
jgi:nucleotide-binding universal stress UspA family protein